MASDTGDRRVHAQKISNEMARLHSEHYGRGPDRVRTVVGHDHVISFLEDMSTPSERTLLAGGEIEAVREGRLAFQRVMEPQFVAVVEAVVGRKVRSFLSQTTFDPDISVEVFVLERDHVDPAPDGIA